jgi:hypothetical protein
MHPLKSVSLFAILILSVGRLAADEISAADPKIIARSPASPGGGAGLGIIQSDLTITFVSPSGTSGDNTLPNATACQVNGTPILLCDFVNESGTHISNLALTISPGGQIDLNCAPSFGFASCDVVDPGGRSAPSQLFMFSGPGIDEGKGFGFILDGWYPNTSFSANFNASGPPTVSPEPKTTCLIISAILLVGFARGRTSWPFMIGHRPNRT